MNSYLDAAHLGFLTARLGREVNVFRQVLRGGHAVRAMLAWLGPGALALIVGCSSVSPHVIENQKPVHPVKGKLTVSGKPAVGAFVLFTPVNEPADAPDPRPRANVEEDGSFSLSTYGENDGAPVGDYIVTVSWEDPDTHDDKLKGRYSDPATSKLRAKVIEGQNELPPFQLK